MNVSGKFESNTALILWANSARMIAVFTLVLAAVPAMQLDDLRLMYAPLMGDELSADGQRRYLDSNVGSITTDDLSFNSGTHDRFGLAYRRSERELAAGIGSFTWGLELGRDRVRLHEGRTELAIEAWMVDVFLGWSWKVWPGWHIEQGILVGIGRSRWDLSHPNFYLDGSAWDSAAVGFASEYGLALAVSYTVSEHLQFGVDLRHTITSSEATLTGDHDSGGGNSETVSWRASSEAKGPGISTWIGYRF